MKKLIYALLSLLFGITTTAQSKNNDYVEWRFTVKKASVNTFAIHVTALIDSPWRIYTKLLNIPNSSLFSIAYDSNAFVIFKNKLQEIGTPIEQYDEVVKEQVRSYRVAANFVQTVMLIVDESVTLHGKIAYVIGDGIGKLETLKEKFKITLNQ